MNEKQQIFEVINGFKNLASKIKKDNNEIKISIKIQLLQHVKKNIKNYTSNMRN